MAEDMEMVLEQVIKKTNPEEYIKILEQDREDFAEEINRLNNIINKAIEFINEMCLCSDGYANYGDDLRPEHIVNILKGDKE